MHDGRYEHIRSLYSRARNEREAEQITEAFLRAFDEKDSRGNYVNDMASWSVRGLYEAYREADIRANRNPDDLRESQGASSFPQAISGLIAKQVLRSHDDFNASRQLVGEQLVTKVPTKKKSEKVLRFSAHPLFKPKPEGVDAQPFEVEEAYYGYRTGCFARNISVTNELVMFDQTEQIWEHAKKLGQGAALTKEYLILHSVMDLQGSHQLGILSGDQGGTIYVYRPSDSGSDMYSASLPYGATDGNLITSNALADWSDIQNCKTRLNGFRDDTPEKLNDASSANGKRMIQPRSKVLLIPEALEEKAWQIMGSRLTPFDANNSNNPAGPGGPLNAPYIVSNILDDQSTSTWFYGSFKETFQYREVFPFRVLTMARADALDMIKKGLYGFVQGEFFAGVAACENRLVVKCTA